MKVKFLSRLRNLLKTLFGLGVLVGSLEIMIRVLGIESYIFPKPSDILFAISSETGSASVAWSVTVSEALVGLAAAIVVSSTLAAATVSLPGSIARIINNAGIAIQSTPLLAIAPLLSLWLGQAFTAKAAAACIVCFFPLLTGWLAGVRSVAPEQLELFDNLHANKWQQAKFLLIPSALPYFFGGLRVAMPLALLGAIVGEFVGASEGIGFRILSNSYYVRTPLMFAYVVIAALTGWFFSTIIAMIEKRVLFWHGQARSI